MGLRSVRRRCQSALDDISLPQPFDLDAFVAQLSRSRGRALTLLPKESALGPCGLWVALPEADFVFYEANTSALHRDHIVLHELGHILRDHSPTASLDIDSVSHLFPHLDPTVVGQVLGRTTYSAVEETEAELIASLIWERAQRDQARDGRVGSVGDVAERLHATLGAQRVSG